MLSPFYKSDFLKILDMNPGLPIEMRVLAVHSSVALMNATSPGLS